LVGGGVWLVWGRAEIAKPAPFLPPRHCGVVLGPFLRRDVRIPAMLGIARVEFLPKLRLAATTCFLDELLEIGRAVAHDRPRKHATSAATSTMTAAATAPTTTVNSSASVIAPPSGGPERAASYFQLGILL